MLSSPKTATRTMSANGWQGEMPAILCPNEPVINIGRPLGKGHSGRKGLRDGGDESLG